jgi:HTH-type transcriptional regulator/antitoxin HipB
MAIIRNTRDLGAALRATREAQGLTQATVAATAGVSRRWLIAIEHGEHPRAELDRVLRVLQALELDVHVGGPQSTTPTSPSEPFDLDSHLATFRTTT